MSKFNANSRFGLVQSTSVTSQFNALNIDRDNFQKVQIAARNKLEATQVKISELKTHQIALSSENRTEQEDLGTHSRKRDMLLQQKARFSRVAENERKALEACVKHSQSLQDTANQATLQYSEDMAQVNEQVASTLHREMHEKMLMLLSVESVEAFVLPRRPAHLEGPMAEAFQALQHAKRCLDEALARRTLLTSKTQKSRAEGRGLASNDQSMGLFYGLSHQGDIEMSYESNNVFD